MDTLSDNIKALLDAVKERRNFSFKPVPFDKSSIRGDYPVSDEELEENYLRILQVEKAQEYCRNCPGLASCPQSTPGIVPKIQVDDGHIYEVTSICSSELSFRKQNKIDKLLLDSHIPKRYTKYSFADVYNANNSMIIAFLQSSTLDNILDKNGVFIFGKNGVGKSLLSAIYAKQQLAAGVDTAFITMGDYLNLIRNSFDQDSAFKDRISVLCDVSCLVLDDFGAERLTPWAVSEIFTFINYRYNHVLKTIITSNFSLDELRNIKLFNRDGSKSTDTYLMNRILNRISDMCYVFELNDIDHRVSSNTSA